MAVFHLVRHGAYRLLDAGLGGRAAHPLDALGRAQAARVGAALAGCRVAAIVSSPVQRALETAEAIGGRLGLAVTPDAAFSEIDFGPWTGRSFDSLRDDPAWQAWNRFRSTAAVPEGEAMLAVQARAVAGLRLLAAHWPQGEVAVVTHGDVIRAVLCHALGAPLDLLQRIDIGAGSVSRVAWSALEVRVEAVNLPP